MAQASQEFLNSYAHFAWNFGEHFLVELEDGRSYLWSDPDYNGDNTMKRLTPAEAQAFRKNHEVLRDKGNHLIGHYCGENINVLE